MSKKKKPSLTGPAKKLSFSLRFAIILVLSAILLAGSVTVFSLYSSYQQVQHEALSHNNDTAQIAVNLLQNQKQNLQLFIDSLDANINAPSSATIDLTQVLMQASNALTPTDVVGTVNGESANFYQKGQLITNNDLVGYAAKTPAGAYFYVNQQDNSTWIVVLKSEKVGKLVVGRPIRTQDINLILSEVTSTSQSNGLELVMLNKFLVDGLIGGQKVKQGTYVDSQTSSNLSSASNGAIFDVAGQKYIFTQLPLDGNINLIFSQPLSGFWSGVGSSVVPTVSVAAVIIILALLKVYVLVEQELSRPLKKIRQILQGFAHEDFSQNIPTFASADLQPLSKDLQRLGHDLSLAKNRRELRIAIDEALNGQDNKAGLLDVCRKISISLSAEATALALLPDALGQTLMVSDNTEIPESYEALLKERKDLKVLLSIGYAKVQLSTASWPKLSKESLNQSALPLRVGEINLGVLLVISKDPIMGEAQELLIGAAEQLALSLIRKRAFLQVQKEAVTDAMTGMYNKGYLMESFHKILAFTKRNSQPISVLMLDLDHFKKFNDTYGHQLGDLVLQAFAKTIISHIRESDFAARYGGEEFMVLLPNTSKAEASLLAERIRQEVAELELLAPQAKQPLRITVSIGISTSPEDADKVNTLIKVADDCLYEAKNKGRNQVYFRPK